MNIPFNKPYVSGNESAYLAQAAESGHISGNGMFTKKCHQYFSDKFGFQKSLLTTSCTDALEMASILANIEPGDEVICPSFAFVSTANAFVLRGAKIVFADSEDTTPNIDASKLESLINPKTKAIVIIHYAGVACNMDAIQSIIKKHKLILIEDAAQAIDAYYNNQILGSFGDYAAFSFHETKNIISGEGGLLVINTPQNADRAEIIWEKGTNRAAFFRGEIDKYGWVDVGSSFLPSELTAAFLFAQLEKLETIQQKRKYIWNKYKQELNYLEQEGKVQLPYIPSYATSNAHMFYLLTERRDELMYYLREKGIHAVFHYLPLHESPFYKAKHDGRLLPNAKRFADTILRFPFFNDLKEEEIDYIIFSIKDYYKKV